MLETMLLHPKQTKDNEPHLLMIIDKETLLTMNLMILKILLENFLIHGLDFYSSMEMTG